VVGGSKLMSRLGDEEDDEDENDDEDNEDDEEKENERMMMKMRISPSFPIPIILAFFLINILFFITLPSPQ
jgi:hypothetical protein